VFSQPDPSELHMQIENGTMPLFTKAPNVEEFTVLHQYPFPGVVNVLHVRLRFDMMLIDETQITIEGLRGMQSLQIIPCDWRWNSTRTTVFKSFCTYESNKGNLVFFTAPRGASAMTPFEGCAANNTKILDANFDNGRRSNNSRLANISAHVTYYLNLTMKNPPSQASLHLSFKMTMALGEHVMPFAHWTGPGSWQQQQVGNITTPVRTVLGVHQDFGAINIVDANTCIALGDATCKKDTQEPVGYTLAHKLHDCAFQGTEDVLNDVMGCMYGCNSSAATIGGPFEILSRLFISCSDS
jgi:hypothetical protein